MVFIRLAGCTLAFRGLCRVLSLFRSGLASKETFDPTRKARRVTGGSVNLVSGGAQPETMLV